LTYSGSVKQLRGGFPTNIALKKLAAFGFFSLERLFVVLFLFTAFNDVYFNISYSHHLSRGASKEIPIKTGY